MSARIERAGDGAVHLHIVATPSGPVFRVGEQLCPAGVMLASGHVLSWQAPALESLSLEDLAPILAAAKPELVLVGTGNTMKMLPKNIRHAALAQGVALEAMDSRAAARTFLLLLAEKRSVAAALLPLA